MRAFILSIFLALGSFSTINSQVVITWEVLKDVKFINLWSEEYQAEYSVARFGKKVKSLDGKKVQIKGYIIPVDVLADYYVLSANPYKNCFFCGQAGPESVMDIQFSLPESGLRLDQIITVEGTLRLNSDDILQLNYILEDAKVVR